MSPVFPPPSVCEDLGGGKIRPVMLVSVALTNEPNIKGGKPVANRQPAIGNGQSADGKGNAHDGATANGGIENRGGGAKMYKWVLGNPPSGEHCGVCLARAGKVKTAAEWAAMGAPPCNCHCSLEEVDDETANRWSAVARAASLAVRREKAARRERGQRTADGGQKAEVGGRRTEDSDAETQRLDAARAAVKRELAERRAK